MNRLSRLMKKSNPKALPKMAGVAPYADSVDATQQTLPAQTVRDHSPPAIFVPNQVHKNPVDQSGGNFKDLSLCFAVDISISTTGRILSAEQFVISKINELTSTEKRRDSHVIPWSGVGHRPIPVNEIYNLETSGGTDPTAIYSSEQHLQILAKSSLWFLLTDGQISKSRMARFAQRTLEHGMHGTSSVVIVFGDRRGRRGESIQPINADISVGLSVYALGANCLFLYHDVYDRSGSAYIFQAKGCFSKYLPSGLPVILDNLTGWHDLPRVQYTELSSVHVPAPQKLGRDEIALKNNLHINLDAMYDGRVDRSTSDQILGDATSMGAIVQAEVARGRSQQLQQFLARQSADDVRSKDKFSAAQYESRSRTMASASARVVADSSSRATTSASLSPWEAPERTRRRALPVVEPKYSTPQNRNLPHSRYISRFENRCMKCGRVSTLALCFKQQKAEELTPEFPPPASFTSLSFPLAMGVFAETDIISSMVYCADVCTNKLPTGQSSTDQSLISGALILQSNSMDMREWRDVISLAFEHRFAREDVLQVFLAVCDATLQRLTPQSGEPTTEPSDEIQLLIKAISWAREVILLKQEPHIPLTMDSSNMSVFSSMSDDAIRQTHPYYLLNSPLEAFAVYIRLEMSFHMNKLSPATISVVVFERLIMHVCHAYASMLAEHGALETSMLLMPLLFQTSGQPLMTSSFRDMHFKYSIDLSDLACTALLDEESLESFTTLGDPSEALKSRMAPAIAVLLHHLIKIGGSDGHSSFGSLRGLNSLQETFENPCSISIEKSRDLISKLLKR